MSEARLLFLVAKYPHPTALARHMRDASMFVPLRRLEARGFLRRQDDNYLLTHRGRDELATLRMLIRLLASTAHRMR